MTGGGCEFVGGFWSASHPVCDCSGDMNGDGQRNGLDIQAFLGCVTWGGVNCHCADMDGLYGADLDDIAEFVTQLFFRWRMHVASIARNGEEALNG